MPKGGGGFWAGSGKPLLVWGLPSCSPVAIGAEVEHDHAAEHRAFHLCLENVNGTVLTVQHARGTRGGDEGRGWLP